MSNPYYWSGFAVLLIMFIAVLNALLSIRSELRRMNTLLEAEKPYARYLSARDALERAFQKQEES